jgi:hypothetical protein
MSNYEPMSAPPPEPERQPARGEAPPSIRRAVSLVWAVVALSVLTAALQFLYIDDIVQATIEAQPDAGISADAARTTILLSGVVFLVLFGALWVLLGVFLNRGANWARIVLTILAGIGVLFGLLNLGGAGGSQPLMLTVTGLVSVVLQAALLYYLWQRDASAYLKPRPAY